MPCFTKILGCFDVRHVWILVIHFVVVYGLETEMAIDESKNRTFCSFFNNRAPSPQPGLRNCTWFRKNSCCKQEEIEAIFGTVKPLPGSSPECQRYTNYLMCYVCAPYQNIFYRREKLTVCEEFCNRWYAACADAILKGAVIGKLYPSGRDFCKSRKFQVEPYINGSCFIYDPSLTLMSARYDRRQSHLVPSNCVRISSSYWTELLLLLMTFLLLQRTC